VLLLSAPVLMLPLVAIVPDQPPEALQLVAFVEDQLSVAEEPLLMLAGLALSVRVGAGTTACPVVLGEVIWLTAAPPQPIRAAANVPHNARRILVVAPRKWIWAICIESRPYFSRSPSLATRVKPSDSPIEQGRWMTANLLEVPAGNPAISGYH
jgi:hypothetical protein